METYISNFEQLVGHTLTEFRKGYDYVEFTLSDGSRYRLAGRERDEDESYYAETHLNGIVGDVNSLINSPITEATYEGMDNTHPPLLLPEDQPHSEGEFLWITSKLWTANGGVGIRFYTTSPDEIDVAIDWHKTRNAQKEKDSAI